MSITESSPVQSSRTVRIVALLGVLVSAAILVTGAVVAAADRASNSVVVAAFSLALMAAGTCLIVALGRNTR